MKCCIVFIVYLALLVANAVRLKDIFDVVNDALEKLNLHPPFYQFWPYKTPNESDIKAAYKAQSLKYHPDKNKSPNANEKFNEIRESYEYLKGSSHEAEIRRTVAAQKYAHHGMLLREMDSAVNSIPGKTRFLYHYVLWRLQDYSRLAKFALYNPRTASTQFIRYLSTFTLSDVLFIAFIAWLSYKLFFFFIYLAKKYTWMLFFSHNEQDLRKRQQLAYKRKQEELLKRSETKFEKKR